MTTIYRILASPHAFSALGLVQYGPASERLRERFFCISEPLRSAKTLHLEHLGNLALQGNSGELAIRPISAILAQQSICSATSTPVPSSGGANISWISQAQQSALQNICKNSSMRRMCRACHALRSRRKNQRSKAMHNVRHCELPISELQSKLPVFL